MKLFLLSIWGFFTLHAAFAQLSPVELSVPMRDGKYLAADLYLPNAAGNYPTIIIQTPYNKNTFRVSGLPLGVKYDIQSAEYAFLVVDWRCYYGSAAACTLSANRGDDGYDVVEWAARQSWSNGKVGTWGPSALGSIQFMTARAQPPHLVCAVPVVVSPQTYYQKYYQGGSLRIDYFDFVGSYFSLNDFVINNPLYNWLWTIAENNTMYPGEIEVPVFIIGGWFDLNTDDCITMFDTLVSSSQPEAREHHRLLIGPWTHMLVGYPNQGDLTFPGATQLDDSLAKAFFDYHLLGTSNNWENSPKIQYYQTGENKMKTTNSWPPADLVGKSFYLTAENNLQESVPDYASAVLNYDYDPQDPSPSVGGKVFGSAQQNNTGPKDISEVVENRNDNLIFTTEPLNESLAVKGKISARLHFSSNRVDTDLALRLTDVYPDGRSVLFGESYLRLRFRNGFSAADTAFMEPGTVYETALEFENLAHTFLPGHRLRIVVTSSNYPRFNRNMNTGGAMYPDGNTDTLINPQIAVNSIHTGEMYPSVVTLPVSSPASGSLENLPENSIKVYPNPTGNKINIGILNPDDEICLFDSRGRLLYKETKPIIGGVFSIDVSDLQKGAYILKVARNNGSFETSKIVVQ